MDSDVKKQILKTQKYLEKVAVKHDVPLKLHCTAPYYNEADPCILTILVNKNISEKRIYDYEGDISIALKKSGTGFMESAKGLIYTNIMWKPSWFKDKIKEAFGNTKGL